MVTRIGLLLALSQGPPGWATTIFDGDRIMGTAPKAAGPPSVLLQNEQATYPVRLEHLRTLADARMRYGGISNATAGLPLTIEHKPGAYTLSMGGRNAILFGTGMLDLVGSDTCKAAGLLGKLYGQFQMTHASTMVPVLGHDVVSIGRRTRLPAGDLRGAVDDSGTALGLVGKSLLREAKKFFPDPIIGIRG